MGLSREQLATLTREEKLRYLELIEEKKRRLREKKDVFVPNDGQRPVLMSRAILRAVFAGNGGGKTAMGANIAKAGMEGYDPWLDEFTPVPARVYVVLDKPEKVESVWLPELRKWMNIRPEQLHKDGKPYVNRISDSKGSFIKFLFHEQDPLTFESIEGDIFIFDEPPPRHVYVGLRRAGRSKGRQARYIIIGTPLSAAWMRKEIYEPWARGEAPDTECFKFGTEVNKANLADGYIEQFAAVLSEKEKRIRLHGDFYDLDGLALAHLFTRATHVIRAPEWKKEWPVVVAIDPHPQKKHVAILLGASPSGLVYLKEISRKCLPRDFARELKDFYRGYRVVDIVCDNLGSSEYTGGEGFKSFIQVLNEEGVTARPTRYDEKVDADWITRVQNVLATPLEADNFGQVVPGLRIVEGCTGIIGDIETVQWARHRNIDEFKPTLDIEAKDFLACLKYALACNLTIKRKPPRPLYRKEALTAYGETPTARRDSIVLKYKRLARTPDEARQFFFHDEDDDS